MLVHRNEKATEQSVLEQERRIHKFTHFGKFRKIEIHGPKGKTGPPHGYLLGRALFIRI
jgi:hypothetical protein